MISRTEWQWRRWRLREGEYRGYTGPRPAQFPRTIPLAWWIRLAAFLARRKRLSVYTGAFSANGAFLRTPGGNTETTAREAFGNGLLWLAANVGDHAAREWDSTIDVSSVRVIPWRRVRDTVDVYHLVAVAKEWQSPALIVNLEDEAKDVLPPSLVRDVVEANGYVGEVALSSLGWLFNDVDWKPLSKWPCLLQWFYGEVPVLRGKWDDCEHHARALGFQRVFPTFQAYATNGVRPDPAECLAASDSPFSLYCGEDVTDWKAWHR